MTKKSLKNTIINFLFKPYRLVGETNSEGETYWKAQVRVNYVNWENIMVDDYKNPKNPYLSKTQGISFLDKNKATYLLEEWKKKSSIKKTNNIIEYKS